ncbi:hypothetical protein [Nocardioides sp. GXZ039]|uniref:hypothetical protein n=1 Tax=Nocardioides sp. GXZ039 TaxID=3136018 RepID=UPI0030F3F01F
MALDYENLDTYLEEAAREAAFAEYTREPDWSYEGDDSVVFKANFGESYTIQRIYLDGRAYSGGTNLGTSIPYEEDAGLAALYAELVSSWRASLDAVVVGWDDLPEGSKLDGIKAACLLALQKVAGTAGDGGSTLPNPDLEAIAFIEHFLPSPEDSGQTIGAFYSSYGPPRLSSVLDSHCQAIAALGVGITGTQELFDTAREDTVTLAANVVEAFRATREGAKPSGLETVLKIMGASLDLVGAFAGPAAATIGGLKAGTSFLSTALGLIPKPKQQSQKYSGSSPKEVLEEFKAGFEAIADRAREHDLGLTDALNSMRLAVDNGHNRRNFHINPHDGVADLGDDIIDLKYRHLETIGYDKMPMVARAFFHAANKVEDADKIDDWYRPYEVGGGSYGAYFAWSELASRIIPLLNDNGAEVVQAGEDLAVAAGWIRESDEGVKRIVGKDFEHVENAQLGWVPPPAPPQPPRRGGPTPYP